MKTTKKKIWQYSAIAAIASVAVAMLVFFMVSIWLKTEFNWPPDESTGIFLIIIALISLAPILLFILDIIREKGAALSYGDFKIDFSKVQQSGSMGFTIPANIGAPGMPVYESSTESILDALQKAGTNSTVVIDIEDGSAWWETRLFVLVSGAMRLGTPQKIVFVATKDRMSQTFLGWAAPADLITCFLKKNPDFFSVYQVAKAIVNQWRLVEPYYPGNIPNLYVPYAFPWMQPGADNSAMVMFDPNTRQTKANMEELILQNELGREIEMKTGGKHITAGRITDLFGEVLHTNKIDRQWSSARQAESFFEDDAPWIAITDTGKYMALVSRMAIINELLKPMMSKE